MAGLFRACSTAGATVLSFSNSAGHPQTGAKTTQKAPNCYRKRSFRYRHDGRRHSVKLLQFSAAPADRCENDTKSAELFLKDSLLVPALGGSRGMVTWYAQESHSVPFWNQFGTRARFHPQASGIKRRQPTVRVGADWYFDAVGSVTTVSAGAVKDVTYGARTATAKVRTLYPIDTATGEARGVPTKAKTKKPHEGVDTHEGDGGPTPVSPSWALRQ
jgi:hypothetical protein